MRFRITFDPGKRERTLAGRGIDFLSAADVFDGEHFSAMDERFDYGEERIITVGYLEGRMVIVVWTERSGARHIISMRKANDRERDKYRKQLD